MAVTKSHVADIHDQKPASPSGLSGDRKQEEEEEEEEEEEIFRLESATAAQAEMALFHTEKWF